MIAVTVTWHPSKRPDTIWNVLAARLGREPTEAEAREEVRRILANRDEITPDPRSNRRG